MAATQLTSRCTLTARCAADPGGYAGTAYLRAVDAGLSVIVLTNREDGPGAMLPIAVGWAVAHAVDASIPEGGYRCWE